MIPVNLILTIVGLLFLLIALVALYVWIGKRKTVSEEVPQKVETFESLSAVIQNRASSNAQLSHAVEMIVNHFGTISPSALPHYKNLLESLCIHPHTDSKLVLRFEKALRQSNTKYSHEIEQALALGLAARG
jgi:uncharacterized iron-regulated membrane protein